MTSASAPGRVNLIGEHTDYNGGFVLPAVIPQRTCVELIRRDDRRAIVHSHELAETAEYEVGAEQRRGDWLDYIQGCTQGLVRAGHRIAGFELSITSEVPLGSGLSSSAALEVATLRGLRDLFGLVLDDVAIALLGQRGGRVVGAPVGMMDQWATSVSPHRPVSRHAQPRDPGHPLPAADLIVISSGCATITRPVTIARGAPSARTRRAGWAWRTCATSRPTTRGSRRSPHLLIAAPATW